MAVESVGWISALILLATIGRQVYSQWRDKSAMGVSKWLFVGQLSASSGFIIYSWMVANWVFVATNMLMVVTALLGELVYLRNRKQVAAPAA